MKHLSCCLKQQKKDFPGLQQRGAGPGGHNRANLKADRPGHRDVHGIKVKGEKGSKGEEKEHVELKFDRTVSSEPGDPLGGRKL